MIVEQADISQIDAIMPIMSSAFDSRFGEAWTKSQCLGLLSLPNTVLMLATTEDKAVGFAIARFVLEEVELMLLGVLPDHCGKGFGAELTARIGEWGKANRAERIFLEVRSGNPALFFYEKLGFVEIGNRKDYYRGSNGELNDATTLSKSLI